MWKKPDGTVLIGVSGLVQREGHLRWQGFVLAEERVKKSHDSYSSGIGAFASARIARRPGGRRYAVVGPSRHGLRAIASSRQAKSLSNM